MSIQAIEQAREKYKPEVIRVLLVAESPPMLETKRFFYFNNVTKGDSLFIETMKVLYQKEFSDVKELRSRKPDFLLKFKSDGLYLLDACKVPMSNSKEKEQKIRRCLPELKHEILSIASQKTPIILISKSVYDALFQKLIQDGFNVINETMIDFPGSGGQKKFREKLASLLKKHGWNLR